MNESESNILNIILTLVPLIGGALALVLSLAGLTRSLYIRKKNYIEMDKDFREMQERIERKNRKD